MLPGTRDLRHPPPEWSVFLKAIEWQQASVDFFFFFWQRRAAKKGEGKNRREEKRRGKEEKEKWLLI